METYRPGRHGVCSIDGPRREPGRSSPRRRRGGRDATKSRAPAGDRGRELPLDHVVAKVARRWRRRCRQGGRLRQRRRRRSGRRGTGLRKRRRRRTRTGFWKCGRRRAGLRERGRWRRGAWRRAWRRVVGLRRLRQLGWGRQGRRLREGGRSSGRRASPERRRTAVPGADTAAVAAERAAAIWKGTGREDTATAAPARTPGDRVPAARETGRGAERARHERGWAPRAGHARRRHRGGAGGTERGAGGDRG